MPLLPVVRALHIAASLLLAGAIAFEILILGRADRNAFDAVRDRVDHWLRVLCAGGLAVGLLSWAAWLALVAAGMSGLPLSEAVSADVMRTVVTQTTFGHVWSMRLALLVLLGSVWLAAGRARRGAASNALAGVAAAALVCSLSWTGHALGPHASHLAGDAVHLLMATLWLGMLPPLALLVRRAVVDPQPAWTEAAAAATRRFSASGMIAVAGLAITGVFNASWLVGSPRDLATTGYGALLLAKIALFLVMVAIALVNRVVLTPRIDTSHVVHAERQASLRRLRRNVVAEVLLGAAVLAIVGVLGVTAPAAHEHARHEGSAMQGMRGV